MDNMEKLTHPIELSGEELDLVAAGWGSQRDNCGCDHGSFINVSDINLAVANNNNVLSFGTGPQTVNQS
jgi:hypothetical protein